MKEIRSIPFLILLSLAGLASAGVPQPPTNVSATAGSKSATISWVAPADTGGLPIKTHTARNTVNGKKCTTTGRKRSCKISGLKNGTVYSFYVTARNKDGTSNASQFTSPVVPFKQTVNAQCGTANNVFTTTQPNPSDLCLVGVSSPVRGEAGIYYWSCTGLRQGANVECKSSGTRTYKIGERGPAGGIVIDVTPDGQHGLEAAQVSLYAKDWGCNGTFLGVTSTSIGSGRQNTSKIIGLCQQAKIAASIANDEKLYGYDDWFLPSKDEMAIMESLGLLKNQKARDEFWTSSEVSSSLVTVFHRRLGDCPPAANGYVGVCLFEYIGEPLGKVSRSFYPPNSYYDGGLIRPARAF